MADEKIILLPGFNQSNSHPDSTKLEGPKIIPTKVEIIKLASTGSASTLKHKSARRCIREHSH